MNITFTEAALSYIQKMLQQKNAAGFRLSVKKTGCSGYAYVPELVVKAQVNDVILEKNGIAIFIDAASQTLLQDIQVDYIEEEKSGLKQKRLVFTNSKEAGRCGCGESFHVS